MIPCGPLVFYDIHSLQKIVTVAFENVCRLAYETSSLILKNALEYNVYHGCLCYILNLFNILFSFISQ